MLLAALIGNSNVVLGVFEGSELHQAWRVPAQPFQRKTLQETPDLAAFIPCIRSVAVGGVNPQTQDQFIDWSKHLFGVKPQVAGQDLTVPLNNRCSPPQSVGMDRLLNAYAARRLFKGDLIVVDFGTAISFSVVSAEGEFLGGAIAPGLQMSARALRQQTALLPEVTPQIAITATGNSTEDAINSGLTWGLSGLVDRILEGLLRERPGCTRILGTGGGLEWFLRLLRHPIEPYPHLGLQGLMFAHRDKDQEGGG